MKIRPVITEYNISLTGYEVNRIQEEYTHLMNQGCHHMLTSNIKELLDTIYKISLKQSAVNNLQRE